MLSAATTQPLLDPSGPKGLLRLFQGGDHFYASTLLVVYTEEVVSAFTSCCSQSGFVRRGLQVRLVSVVHSIIQMCMGRVQSSSKIIRKTGSQGWKDFLLILKTIFSKIDYIC